MEAHKIAPSFFVFKPVILGLNKYLGVNTCDLLKITHGVFFAQAGKTKFLDKIFYESNLQQSECVICGYTFF